MKKAAILFLLLVSTIPVFAQRPGRLTTPYRTLNFYLINLTDENYNPDTAALVFYPNYIGSTSAPDLAVKLKQILDGRGLYVDLGKVPDRRDYLDSLLDKHQYIINDSYPNLYLEKVGSNWYISKSTTEQIGFLHKETFPFGTDKLLNLLPKAGNYKVLGIKIWQYVGILIIVIIAFVFNRIFRSFLTGFFSKVLKKWGGREEILIKIRPVVLPGSNALIFILIKFLIPILQLPIYLSHYANMIVAASVPFFVMIALYRSVDLLDIYFTRLSLKTESTLDDQLVPLIRKSLKAFVVIIGVLIILQNFDLDIVPILAGLSVGGVAIALAAQDTIKNLFGSVMIFIDKPFQVGHWITASDLSGTVEEVGIRSTRIRTFSNSVVYVPNGKLADSVIDNHGLRQYRRFYTQIAVTYDTPADLIELFVDGLKQITKDHPETRKDYYEIYLNDMAASSLNIMFYIFFKVPTWSDELRCRQEVLLSIIRLAEKIGINFAFPTQTLNIENMPGQLSNSPTYKTVNELKPDFEAFLKKNRGEEPLRD